MWQQGGQARKWQERAILESSRTEGIRKGWKNRLGKRQLGWTRRGLSVLQTAFRNRAVTCWGTITQGRHPGLTSDLSFNSTRNQVLFIASLGLCPALASLLAQMLWWMPITCQSAMFRQSNYNSAQSLVSSQEKAQVLDWDPRATWQQPASAANDHSFLKQQDCPSCFLKN